MAESNEGTRCPTVAHIVKLAITRKEFSDAWKDIGETGCGSRVAVKRAFELIKGSKLHLESLLSESTDIMKLAADWADSPMTEEELTKFHWKIAEQITTIAACFLVIGAMVGIASTCPSDKK